MLWSKLEFDQIQNLSSQNWNSSLRVRVSSNFDWINSEFDRIPILTGQIRNLAEFQFWPQHIYHNNVNFSADMDPILILFRKNLDSPSHFRQLTKVHCTFANISPGISPIYPQDFRHWRISYCRKSGHPQPPLEKKLFLLQLRNESHCRLPTYLLLKLVALSVLVLSFRPKSIVVQVLLKEKKNISHFSGVKIVQPPVYSCTNMAMKKTNAISQWCMSLPYSKELSTLPRNERNQFHRWLQRTRRSIPVTYVSLSLNTFSMAIPSVK